MSDSPSAVLASNAEGDRPSESEVCSLLRALLSKFEASEKGKQGGIAPKPENFQAEETTPSGTNTVVPAMEDKDKDKERDSYRARYDSVLVDLQNYRRENMALKAQMEAIAERFQAKDREQTLMEIKVAENLEFDIPRQLELTKGMDNERFAAHCEMIKENFTKSSVGAPLISPRLFRDTGGNTLTPSPRDEAHAAVQDSQEAAEHFQAILRSKAQKGAENKRGVDAALAKAQAATADFAAKMAARKTGRAV